MTNMFQRLSSDEFDALSEAIDLRIVTNTYRTQERVEQMNNDIKVYGELI